MIRRVSACCEVRRQLAETFAIAARLYAEIAVNFGVSGISQEDHMRLCRRAEEARERSQTACVAYEEHVDSHRCWYANNVGQNIVPGVVEGTDKSQLAGLFTRDPAK
jgi:hypothetical protein